MITESVEILTHAIADLEAGAITREQYNDIRLSCITAEIENELLEEYVQP